MRIISGSVGRRNISVPQSIARPSTDRLREALFSILSGRIHGARVLDLFAGSGALGLESLSRGALSALMIDDNREAYLVIEKNLASLGLDAGRVMQSDVIRFLNRDRGSYDLIFADPPYFKQSNDRDFVEELLSHPFLPDRLTENGLLMIEDPPDNLRGDIDGWELLDQRRYGGCRILFYQRAKTT